MSKVSGVNSRVYVDQYDFSGSANSVGITVDADLPEVTTFADLNHVYLEATKNAKFDFGGFFVPTTSDPYQNDPQFYNAILAGAKYWAFAPNTANQGNPIYELTVKAKNYKATSTPKGAVVATAQGQSSGYFGRGVILASGPFTFDGQSSASIDMGLSVPPSPTTVMTMRILSITGSASTFQFRIQQSNDAAGVDPWTNIATLPATAFNAGPLISVFVVAGTKQFLRVLFNVAGGTGWSVNTVMSAYYTTIQGNIS